MHRCVGFLATPPAAGFRHSASFKSARSAARAARSTSSAAARPRGGSLLAPWVAPSPSPLRPRSHACAVSAFAPIPALFLALIRPLRAPAGAGKDVALKSIRLDGTDEGVPSTAIREISLLKELQHGAIVQLIEVLHQPDAKLTLVFEFLQCDLKQYMDQRRVSNRIAPSSYMSIGEAESFTKQLLEGVAYCHSRRILHRDLKPQNLLIDPTAQSADGYPRLKIADFGLARAFGIPIRSYTHEVVTLWYRAPEILLGQRHYSVPVDVWSVGCIFAEMVNHTPLFPGDSEIDELFRIFRKLGTPNAATWPGVERLDNFQPALFPRWGKLETAAIVPRLCGEGCRAVESEASAQLLMDMLKYEPRARVSAAAALRRLRAHGVDAPQPPHPTPATPTHCSPPGASSAPTTKRAAAPGAVRVSPQKKRRHAAAGAGGGGGAAAVGAARDAVERGRVAATAHAPQSTLHGARAGRGGALD